MTFPTVSLSDLSYQDAMRLVEQKRQQLLEKRADSAWDSTINAIKQIAANREVQWGAAGAAGGAGLGALMALRKPKNKRHILSSMLSGAVGGGIGGAAASGLWRVMQSGQTAHNPAKTLPPEKQLEYQNAINAVAAHIPDIEERMPYIEAVAQQAQKHKDLSLDMSMEQAKAWAEKNLPAEEASNFLRNFAVYVTTQQDIQDLTAGSRMWQTITDYVTAPNISGAAIGGTLGWRGGIQDPNRLEWFRTLMSPSTTRYITDLNLGINAADNATEYATRLKTNISRIIENTPRWRRPYMRYVARRALEGKGPLPFTRSAESMRTQIFQNMGNNVSPGVREAIRSNVAPPGRFSRPFRTVAGAGTGAVGGELLFHGIRRSPYKIPVVSRLVNWLLPDTTEQTRRELQKAIDALSHAHSNP